MTFAEIDCDTWHLAADRTKNGRAHDVPLAENAKTILALAMRGGSKSGYVFTTTGGTPVSGFSKAHRMISTKMVENATKAAGEAVEIPAWKWHDLRRTCETGMARLRVSQEIIDRVTNHVSGQHRMVRVYNHHNYAEEKREALDLWARAIDRILEGHDGIEQVRRRG
jgi:integrase